MIRRVDFVMMDHVGILEEKLMQYPAKMFTLHKDYSLVDVIRGLVSIRFSFQQCFSGYVCINYIKCLFEMPAISITFSSL